jgi:hypothetical protein
MPSTATSLRNAATVAASFLLPPIGMWLVWRERALPSTVQVALTGAVLFWCLFPFVTTDPQPPRYVNTAQDVAGFVVQWLPLELVLVGVLFLVSRRNPR